MLLIFVAVWEVPRGAVRVPSNFFTVYFGGSDVAYWMGHLDSALGHGHLGTMTQTDPAQDDPALNPAFAPGPAERPAWPAIRKGLRGRCPNCGEGRLFASYLKLRPDCASCGEDLSHARADDGPAYLSILVTAKIVGTAMLFTFERVQLEPLVMAVLFSTLSIVMALWLLPRFKGLIVGVQWAKRMHGF